MYFAPVTPPHLLDLLPTTVHAHLILSNQVFATREAHSAYARFFDRTEPYKDVIILDNPIHERQPIPPMADRLEAARLLNVNVIVAPDVIGNPHDSTRLLNHHLKSPLAQPPYEALAVVQGFTATEYESHIRHLAHRGLTWIGVPQVRQEGTTFNRAKFLLGLKAAGFFEEYPQVSVHLLGNIGMFEDACELVSKVPQVIGIDSAKPVYLASLGIDIRCVDQARKTRRPAGYFELQPGQVDASLLAHNVRTVQEWLGDRSDIEFINGGCN